jgi:5-methylcytosine-specific restriction protein A
VQGRCLDCTRKTQRVYDQHRERDGFYSTAAWLGARAQQLAEHPCCEDCSTDGKVTAATEVHHRIKRKLRPDLSTDPANLASLCRPHHSRRTRRGE